MLKPQQNSLLFPLSAISKQADRMKVSETQNSIPVMNEK